MAMYLICDRNKDGSLIPREIRKAVNCQQALAHAASAHLSAVVVNAEELAELIGEGVQIVADKPREEGNKP